MIVQEVLDSGLVRRSSDSGLMIRKIGTDELYGEAIDLSTSSWDYEETDIPIEVPEVGEPVGEGDTE